MENEDQNLGNQPTGGALSIYGQADAAMDDFPVLKAFQQYIDAEQSKSRKRMILLCMFFGALMTILVAVFVFMLAQASRDKQHVNDQLIQFLMKERERQPIPTPAPQPTVVQPTPNPAQDAALKAMTETLANMQKQIAEQRKAAQEAAASAPTKAELEMERKAAQEAEKLRQAKEKIEAEKRALAEEKERLRQAEIERQRRRLYPEYYQKQEQGAQQAPSQTPSPRPVAKKPKAQFTDEDIDDILREVDALKKEEEQEAAKQKKKKSDSKRKDSKKKDDAALKSDRPIEYFNEHEYTLPVSVNGEDTGFSIPLPDDDKEKD